MLNSTTRTTEKLTDWFLTVIFAYHYLFSSYRGVTPKTAQAEAIIFCGFHSSIECTRVYLSTHTHVYFLLINAQYCLVLSTKVLKCVEATVKTHFETFEISLVFQENIESVDNIVAWFARKLHSSRVHTNSKTAWH